MALNLLVVEDSLTVRKLVEIAFKDTDATLTFAVSGTEGLARATQGSPPQVILLDLVLPDMRGADVCRRLADDPRLAGVPVVLMSANNLDVRERFAAFPAVVDFVTKPFSREEIVRRLLRAASGAAPAGPASPAVASAPEPGLFSYDQKQAAARLVFRHLKPQLAQIPSWAQQMGEAPAATYYARKILTAEVMEQVLAELAPIVLEAATAAADGSTRLAGQISGSALMDLLRMLEGGRKTGTMNLRHSGTHLVAHVRDGAVVRASSFDPDEYLRESELSLEGMDAEARTRAEEEQRRTGKPLYAALVEAGLLASADAQRAMAQQARRLLRRALREAACRLEWHETELPPLGGSLEQPIPVAQLWLERLRVVAPRGELERGVPSFQTVFERAERFSARVRQLDLTGSERRILALVDGRAGVQELVDRSGIPTKEAAHVLFRLAEIGLLRRRAGLLPRQKVMILEPDVEGFRRPLAALLGSRPRPADLLALDEAGDLVAAVLRERPALVLLNVSAVGADQAVEIARALCAQPDAVGGVVALLEPDAAVDDLVESPHFDAVLTKPIHASEIERLLPG